MIFRHSDIFYRFGNDRILPKKCVPKIELLGNRKLYNNYARYTMLKKSVLMVYVGTYHCYDNIKIKF